MTLAMVLWRRSTTTETIVDEDGFDDEQIHHTETRMHAWFGAYTLLDIIKDHTQWSYKKSEHTETFHLTEPVVSGLLKFIHIMDNDDEARELLVADFEKEPDEFIRTTEHTFRQILTELRQNNRNSEPHITFRVEVEH